MLCAIINTTFMPLNSILTSADLSRLIPPRRRRAHMSRSVCRIWFMPRHSLPPTGQRQTGDRPCCAKNKTFGDVAAGRGVHIATALCRHFAARIARAPCAWSVWAGGRAKRHKAR